MQVDDVLLEMRGITKTFPGVKALDNVSFASAWRDPRAGRRERGRQVDPDEGPLAASTRTASTRARSSSTGEECRFHGHPRQRALGIVIIHQELALIPHLSITENIFLGNEQAAQGVIDWSRSLTQHRVAQEVGLDETPDTPHQPARGRQATARRDRQGPRRRTSPC